MKEYYIITIIHNDKEIFMDHLKKVVRNFWDCTEVTESTTKKNIKTTKTYALIENGEISTDSINKCIERATVDMTVRTLKKVHNIDNGVLKILAEKISEELTEHIINWLEPKDQNRDYEDWHKKACEKVLEVIKHYYKNKDGSDVCYGKAQKVVNMTMKTIYCLVCNDDNAFKNYNSRFDPCHIPLDSFTINWYRKYGKIDKNWSNLDEKDYYTISSSINELFESEKVEEFYGKLTPLQAEFFIWEEEKLKALVKELEKGIEQLQQNAELLKLFNISTNKIPIDIE